MNLIRAIFLGSILAYSLTTPALAQGHGGFGPGQGDHGPGPGGDHGGGFGPGQGGDHGGGFGPGQGGDHGGGGFGPGHGDDHGGGGFGPGHGDDHGGGGFGPGNGGFGPGHGDDHGGGGFGPGNGGFGPGHGGFDPLPPSSPVGPCQIVTSYNGSFTIYTAYNAYGQVLTTNSDYNYVYQVAANAEARNECSYITNVNPTPPPAPVSYCQVLPGRNAFGQTYYNVETRSGAIIYTNVFDYNQALNYSRTDARCFQ